MDGRIVMSVKTEFPKLYSGFFASLTAEGSKDSFHKRYKHFKEKCHCKSTRQVIKLSREHLAEVDDVDNLERMLAGLKVVRREYPNCSRTKRLMRLFNRQYRNKMDNEMQSLDALIGDYEAKLIKARYETRLVREDPLADAVEGQFSIITSSEEKQWKEVQQLLKDQVFCERAKECVKTMAETPELPPAETIRIWGAAMKGILDEYSKGKVTSSDVKIALLLAGKENTPKLLRYMKALREKEPSLASEFLAQSRLSVEQAEFEMLARLVEHVVGIELFQELDLQGQSHDLQIEAFKAGMVKHEFGTETPSKGDFEEKGFANSAAFYVEKLKEKLSELAKHVLITDEEKKMISSNAQYLVTKMNEDRLQLGPGHALENLRIGVEELYEELYGSEVQVDDGQEMKVVIDSSSLEPIIEAIVVRLIQKSELTEDFSAFTLMLEQCLKETDATSLTPETHFAVSCFVRHFKKYAGVDFSEALVQKAGAIQKKVDEVALHVKIGHHEMLEDCKHKNEVAVKEALDVEVRGLLERRRKEPDIILERSDFPIFIDELIDVSSKKSQEDEIQPLSRIFSVISSYEHKLGKTQGERFDQQSLDDLFFAFSEKNPEQFARFILQLGDLFERQAIQEDNFVMMLCNAVDYAAGIDPRKVSGYIPVSAASERQIEITKRAALYREYIKTLATAETNKFPDGVDESEVEEAKKVYRLLQDEDFQKEVKAMLEEYVDRSQILGTLGARRLLRRRLYDLRSKYSDIWDPSGKGAIGMDEYTPFLLGVSVVQPALGAKVLRLLSREDVDTILNPEDNEDSLVFLWLNQEALFETVEPRIVTILQEMKEQPLVGEQQIVGTDAVDLGTTEGNLTE